MYNSIQKALNPIVAEEDLKRKTISALYAENKEPIKQNNVFVQRKWIGALASFFMLFVVGTISFHVYNIPAASINIEINPALELTINRFDRVLDAYAYNEDGEKLLAGMNLKNQKCDAVIEELVASLAQKGYLKTPESLLSVTFESKNAKMEQTLLTELTKTAQEAMSAHHCQNQVEVFAVSSQVMGNAQNHHISPAKYIAITELQKMDASVTVEGCKNHTITELRQMAENHVSHTHSQEQIEDQNQPELNCHRHHHGNCQNEK